MAIKFDRERGEYVTAPLTAEQADILNRAIREHADEINAALAPVGLSLNLIGLPSWERAFDEDEH